MEQIQAISAQLSDLRLSYFNRSFAADLEKMDRSDQDAITKWLAKWCGEEKIGRYEAMIQSKIKGARFRRIQTVDEYDFKHSQTTEKVQKNYLNLHRNVAKDNLPSAVFTGNAGVGKTHLARALGYACCQKGISVLFVTAAELVNQLQHAQKAFSLETELNKYRRPQVLIIDELGYVSLDTQASNLFFQVISARHDARLGTIATTNLPFGKFNQIFANDAIAHAIVDRLVNEAEVFFMEGESYRQHQRKQKIGRKEKDA